MLPELMSFILPFQVRPVKSERYLILWCFSKINGKLFIQFKAVNCFCKSMNLGKIQDTTQRPKRFLEAEKALKKPKSQTALMWLKATRALRGPLRPLEALRKCQGP
jgi:hypothetical protein